MDKCHFCDKKATTKIKKERYRKKKGHEDFDREVCDEHALMLDQLFEEH